MTIETPVEKQLNPAEEMEKKAVLEKLVKAKSTTERVQLFGKVMDTYGADAIVSLIPVWGDGGVSIASSMYLLYEGSKMGLSARDSLKILGYQTADFFVGAIPVIGDIADYFFKASKRSAELFQKHFEKLKKEAIKKGTSPQEIVALEENNDKFIKMMSKNIPAKTKTGNKAVEVATETVT